MVWPGLTQNCHIMVFWPRRANAFKDMRGPTGRFSLLGPRAVTAAASRRSPQDGLVRTASLAGAITIMAEAELKLASTLSDLPQLRQTLLQLTGDGTRRAASPSRPITTQRQT